MPKCTAWLQTPLMLATQWSSVSDGALGVLAQQQGALCVCFKTSSSVLKVTFPNLRIACNVMLKGSVVVCFAHPSMVLFHLCVPHI